LLGLWAFLLLELEGVVVPLEVLHPRPVLTQRVLIKHQVLLEFFLLFLLGKLLRGLTDLWLESEHVDLLLALGLLEQAFFTRALQADRRPLSRMRSGVCLRPRVRILVRWRGFMLAVVVSLLPHRGALRVMLYLWLVKDQYRNSLGVSAVAAMA
jgi:hypothetical protein